MKSTLQFLVSLAITSGARITWVAQTLPFMSAPLSHLIQTGRMPGLIHFYGRDHFRDWRRHTNQCLRYPQVCVMVRVDAIIRGKSRMR